MCQCLDGQGNIDAKSLNHRGTLSFECHMVIFDIDLSANFVPTTLENRQVSSFLNGKHVKK